MNWTTEVLCPDCKVEMVFSIKEVKDGEDKDIVGVVTCLECGKELQIIDIIGTMGGEPYFNSEIFIEALAKGETFIKKLKLIADAEAIIRK